MAISQIHLFKREGWKSIQLRHARGFEVWIIVGIEIVDPEHGVTVAQEPARDVHANEAGRAGDENALTHPDFLTYSAVPCPHMLERGMGAGPGIQSSMRVR
jgi:hypothetical protein